MTILAVGPEYGCAGFWALILQKNNGGAVEPNSIAGIEFDAILRGWVVGRTVKEVVDVMNAVQVACSAVMSVKDMAEDTH